jgi:putative MATE family efflux protein
MMSSVSNQIQRRSIFKIAIPATIAGIAEPLLSLTDTAIVGNIPQTGLISLAAAGIVGSYLSMLIWVLGQSRAALASLIAQYLGGGQLKEIEELPAQALLINIGISILLVVGSIAFMRPILELMNAEGTLLEYCESYFKIRIWGFPLTLITFAVFGMFRGLQNTYWPMLIAATGAILNVGLDYLLVFGWEGYVPAMYLEGAAWASLIAQGVMAVMSLILMYYKTNFRIKLSRQIHPELRRYVKMSLHLFIRTLALNAALIYSVKTATALGNAYIGAHTIAFNLWLFAAFLIDGFSSAANLMGGRFLGAKQYDLLRELIRKTSIYALILSLLIMGVGVLFYEPIGYLFSNDPKAVEVFKEIFLIVILFMPLNALAFIYDGLFKGLGETAYLRNVLLASSFLGFIPFVYISVQLGWGLKGIWMGFAFWILLRYIALAVKFRLKFLPLARKD